MKKAQYLKNSNWRRLFSVESAKHLAPARPGVYAYAEVTHVHGLPTALNWIYVGQARKLSQRFAQHSRSQERNPGLLHWLETPNEREVWYVSVSSEVLDQLERDLIVALQPRLNRVRYKSHQAVRDDRLSPQTSHGSDLSAEIPQIEQRVRSAS